MCTAVVARETDSPIILRGSAVSLFATTEFFACGIFMRLSRKGNYPTRLSDLPSPFAAERAFFRYSF